MPPGCAAASVGQERAKGLHPGKGVAVVVGERLGGASRVLEVEGTIRAGEHGKNSVPCLGRDVAS